MRALFRPGLLAIGTESQPSAISAAALRGSELRVTVVE
jgi:hypothetical protein